MYVKKYAILECNVVVYLFMGQKHKKPPGKPCRSLKGLPRDPKGEDMCLANIKFKVHKAKKKVIWLLSMS